MKLPSPRSAKRDRSPEAPEDTGAERPQAPARSTKIEEAAERAAAATRTAAEKAAADRAHARPRTSVLAGVSLVTAVTAALVVSTGSLAVLGIAVGVVALLLAIGATVTTGRHFHFLAGRAQAWVALLVAIAAVVIGALAAAGSLPWLDTDTDQVARLRDNLPSWLT